MKRIFYGFFLFLIAGCSPNSLDDYQKEGQALCRILVSDLRKVQTREELLKIEPILKKRFQHLVELMIQAKNYHLKHPDEVPLENPDHFFSEQLQLELQRIYHLEGGREMIERTQREALIRFDAFERKLKKD